MESYDAAVKIAFLIIKGVSLPFLKSDDLEMVRYMCNALFFMPLTHMTGQLILSNDARGHRSWRMRTRNLEHGQTNR